MDKTGRNIKFQIYNEDGTPFHDLVINKSTYESVIMSLGDKITGDVYYKDNSLIVTMNEYILMGGVRYILVDPPVVVREGLVSDNSELKGATKYSFTFYHPMCLLGNFPFSDIAVTNNEQKYLSQNKTFAWVGNLFDFVVKLNANLKSTEWDVRINIAQYEDDGVTETTQWGKAKKLSDPITFDKVFVSDALKTSFDTWGIPFVVNDYDGVLPQNYTRLEWVEITEMHQAVSDTTSPFWLFINNLGSVRNNHRVYYCKVYDGDELLLHLIPSKRLSDDAVGLYDVVRGVFYVSNAEVTFVAGDEIGVNKKHEIVFGMPNNMIYDKDGNEFVFRFGQGVGLKNNSRTPKNNKIVTRIAGYGSSDNIQYGYPQIVWAGNQSWNYTINNAEGMQPIEIGGQTIMAMSYPIYDGVVGGQPVKLIKHPFTRDVLMPSIYRETVNKKVNPLATGYDPDIEIKDYYDADISYPNPISLSSPSFHTQEFAEIKPRLGSAELVDVKLYDNEHAGAITYQQHLDRINGYIAAAINENEKEVLTTYRQLIDNGLTYSNDGRSGGSYTWHENFRVDGAYMYVKFTSDNANFSYIAVRKNFVVPPVVWDDTMDDDGNYKQSYFKVTLPLFDFDLYACASITQSMQINMRSGACIGCTFEIQVDWEDYKNNFYDRDGRFSPQGLQRDFSKYPDSRQEQITVILKKETETYGTLMPNAYQNPKDGDEFVILGISLPQTYVTSAEEELGDAMKEYMLENNVYHFDYPLKFDEYFLATHTNILAQMHNNSIVRFEYPPNVENTLYIKQMTVKYGDKPLPQYDITLTDDVEIVLNKIGQVTDDVSRMRVQMNELQKYYGEDVMSAINEKLSRVVDDVCQGRITFQQGLNAIGSAIFQDEIRSSDFESGTYTGHGWRLDQLGNGEFESLRIRTYLEVVELIINRMQAQEGDTLYTDNDQIDKVEEKVYSGTTYFILSLKEKWQGYVTSQQKDNILKGIINTLAAKYANVSDVDDDDEGVSFDGVNSYYTSWMKVIDPASVGESLGANQIAVVLYGDAQVPSQKNFKPCELMTVARWGCDADPNAQGLTPAQKQSIIRRQRMFQISNTDGRITKFTGVNKPILVEGNYGTTLGTIPEFINNWSIRDRLIEGRDYLYAQGVIVGDFIKVDIHGNPLINYVDCGDWHDNTRYLHNEYNAESLQWETNDVWHNGAYWRCLISQPYQNVYYEPTEENSLYWKEILQSGDDAVTYGVRCPMNSIIIPSDRSYVDVNTTFSFYKKDGDAVPSAYSANYSVYVYNGSTYTRIATGVGTSKTINATILSSSWKIACYVFKSAYVGTQPEEQPYLAKLVLDTLKDGDRGKTGRFYYYAGEFDASDTSKTFVVSDVQAPYFHYNNGYWVFNPTTNGSYTMAQMGNPSSSSSNWMIMVNDFKYLITEAIFGSYAHFGSAIINGDYLISQHGYMVGFNGEKYTDGSNYLQLDYDDINAEEDMHSDLWIDDSSEYTVGNTDWQSYGVTQVFEDVYFALEIDEVSRSSTIYYTDWRVIEYGNPSNVIASGIVESKAGGENINSFIFKANSTVLVDLQMRTHNGEMTGGGDIEGIYMRPAKFVPHLAIDLKVGTLITNKIVARGELHADSLYYSMVYGNSNNDSIVVGEESIVNLSTRAVGTLVTLPQPSESKGRVIELYSHASSISLSWRGASSTDTFSAAYGSSLGLRVQYSYTGIKYIKFYCDGTSWWVLKKE